VEDVGRVPVTDVGFYTGLIESVFAFVQMCVMLGWGRLSDRLGRKPILVVCMVGVAAASIMFGFSTSIWEMIMFRCIAGFMGASLVTIRTMISENCTKNTQGLAFAWFSTAGHLGVFLGPLMGGVLADPISQYSGFPRIQLLVDHPYCLPGIVTGFMGLSAAVMCFFYLEETLPSAKHPDSESGSENTSRADDGRMSVREILRYPGVFNVLVTNGFMFAVSFSYSCMIPVFAFTPIEYGGLSFSPVLISTFLASLGISQTFWSLAVFPSLHRRLGTQRTVQAITTYYPLVFLNFPIFNFLLRQQTEFATRVFWVYYVVFLMVSPALTMAWPATHLTVNDVVPSPQTLGTLTGITLSLANVFRTVVPATVTSLYGLSIKHSLLTSQLFWGLHVAIAAGYAVSARYLPRDPK
jgi:MFS family permease